MLKWCAVVWYARNPTHVSSKSGTEGVTLYQFQENVPGMYRYASQSKQSRATEAFHDVPTPIQSSASASLYLCIDLPMLFSQRDGRTKEFSYCQRVIFNMAGFCHLCSASQKSRYCGDITFPSQIGFKPLHTIIEHLRWSRHLQLPVLLTSKHCCVYNLIMISPQQAFGVCFRDNACTSGQQH